MALRPDKYNGTQAKVTWYSGRSNMALRPDKYNGTQAEVMWHSGRIEQSVAISRIERWQSAALRGGNQPHSKGFAEDTAKMHSADFKHQKGLPWVKNWARAYR